MLETLIPATLNFASGLLNGGSSGATKEARHIQYDTWQMNKDLAYNGVQRRMEDAKKAGVNPLAALGMNPYQGSVAQMAGDIGGSDNGLGRLAAAGADLSRAIASGQNKEQRAFTQQMAALQLERGSLENDLLRSQIAGQRAQLAPSIPVNTTGIKAALADLPTPLGLADGLTPAHRLSYDKKGNVVEVYNDDLGDNEGLQALEFATRSLPQWLWNNTGGRYFQKNIQRHVRNNRGQPYSYKWPRGFTK